MNKSEISFGQVVSVCLMIVILMLAGCSSKPIPSATSTATYEATATSTATLEPTPTIAPKPGYVTDENSIETDNGIVFVKDGKAMMYDLKTGIVVEIKDISTEVTFNTTEDASKIVLALHSTEFSDQEQLYKDVTPGKVQSDFSYNMSVNQMSEGSVETGVGGFLEVVGIPVEIVKVTSPVSSGDDIAVAMLKVYGDERPAPLAVGFVDAKRKFFSLYSEHRQYSPDSYRRDANYVQLEDISLGRIKELLIGNIVVAEPLFVVGQSNTIDYKEDPVGVYDSEGVSAEAIAERKMLIPLQVMQAEYGADYIMSGNSVGKTGKDLTGYEATYLADGNSNFILLDVYDFLSVIVVTP